MGAESTSTNWYYLKAGAAGGQQTGPLTWDQLRSLAGAGILTATDMVWHPSLPQWLPAAQVAELLPQMPRGVPSVPPPPRPGALYQSAGAYAPARGPAAPRRSRAWQWMVPLLAVILVGVGLGIYFGLRGEDGVTTAGSQVTTGGTITGEATAAGTAATETTTGVTVGATTATEATTTTTLPSKWTKLSPSGDIPPERAYHTMAYDPVSGKIIMYGGTDWEQGSVYYPSDTWAYDPGAGTWSDCHPTGVTPFTPEGSALVYDPGTRGMILFGGWADDDDDPTMADNLWTYDPSIDSWTEIEPGNAEDCPLERDGACFSYDPGTGTVLMYGGWNNEHENDEVFDELWAFDPGTSIWTQLHPTGESPGPRAYNAMVYDPVGEKMIMYGGWEDDEDPADDLWAYDPAAGTWTELHPAGDVPASHSEHAMVYDQASARILMFGGTWWDIEADDYGPQDMWAYDPAANAWTDLDLGGEIPDFGHAPLVYDPRSGKTFLFGGAYGDESDETWVFGG